MFISSRVRPSLTFKIPLKVNVDTESNVEGKDSEDFTTEICMKEVKKFMPQKKNICKIIPIIETSERTNTGKDTFVKYEVKIHILD